MKLFFTLSLACLSRNLAFVHKFNETKITSANEWRFDEGCEKSPSAVILAFFTGTSSLRNLNTHPSTINLNQFNDASKIVF